MTDGPLFTVVVPTHNRADLLGRAIASVLDQTLSDFELIIVDDSSTDATQEVVSRVSDKRVRYLRRDENGGAAATRNSGIRAAQGDLIALLDDDDEYLPEFLARTYDVLSRAPVEVGFTWCGVRWVRDTENEEVLPRDEIWQPSFQSRHEAYLSFLDHRPIGTNSGLCFRRCVFDSVGFFDESFRVAQDTDFLIRLVRHFDFRVVPEILIKIHLHRGPHLRRISAETAKSYELLLAKHHRALEEHSKLAASLYYKTGWLHYHAGLTTLGRRYLLRAIKRYPFHIKSWIAIALFETFGAYGLHIHRLLSSLRRRRKIHLLSPKKDSNSPAGS